MSGSTLRLSRHASLRASQRLRHLMPYRDGRAAVRLVRWEVASALADGRSSAVAPGWVYGRGLERDGCVWVVFAVRDLQVGALVNVLLHRIVTVVTPLPDALAGAVA